MVEYNNKTILYTIRRLYRRNSKLTLYKYINKMHPSQMVNVYRYLHSTEFSKLQTGFWKRKAKKGRTKVKNARKSTYDGKNFQSNLELYCYKQLEAAEELRERQKRGVPLDPIYNQGDSMDLNAQDFAASINR